MTGYTALMQENEQLARLKRRRLKEVLESSIAAFNGKVLQYYGDGSLSIFSSAIDSAICAVTSELRKRAAARVAEVFPEFDLSVVTRSGRVL